MSSPEKFSPAVAAIARAAHNRGQLERAATRRGMPGADAEDAVSAGVARALSRARQLRETDRADAWVGRIVQHAVVDELRASRSPTIALDADTLPSAIPDAGVDCWCVLAQMKALGATHQAILRRVVLDGQSLSTAAAELGISPNAATVRLHRARTALRSRLAAHCGTRKARSCSDCGCAERGCCG